MAAAVPQPASAGPIPVAAPPLPYPGGPGTITGWLLDQSASITLDELVRDIEAGFARLLANMPANPVDPGDQEALRELVDKVLNSDDLCCYLTVSETGEAAS